MAAEDLDAVAVVTNGETRILEELVADKGYHSNQVLVDRAALDLRTYIAEPDRGRRNWHNKADARAAVYANRRRTHGARGLALLRRRSASSRTPWTVRFPGWTWKPAKSVPSYSTVARYRTGAPSRAPC